MRTIGTGTDWQDQIFRKAVAHNHQLSFSGGSDKSAFYLGVNYLSQEGVVKRSGLKKYNVRLNYELNPSDKFKINLNLNTNRSINNSILTTNAGNENAGPMNTALQFDPTIAPGLNAQGRYPFNSLISLENPLALINGVDQSNVSNRTFGTLSSEYTILKGWTATLRLGGDIENQRSDSYVSTATQRGLASGGNGNVISLEDNHWISELFTTYNRTFAKHQISVLGGATLEKYETRLVGASAMGFLSDVSLTNLLEGGDGDRGDNVRSSRTTNKLNSYLGRLNYTFNEKYLLTASMRADGTSRFSDKNKFAFFPSFALGWRLSEEPFLKQTNLFNDLKLRLSYGKSGNQAIGNFETLQTFIAGGRAILGGGLLQGVEPARIPNPDLKWETTEELDLGIDFGVFQGRLSGSLEYFIKNTSDQLFNKPLPTTSGFESIRVNFGTVRNRGIDLMLESRNFVNNFKWNTTFTFSALQNKVVELPDFIPQVITGNIGFTSNYAIVRTGAAMRSFYGYQVERLFQTNDDIASSAQPGAKPGQPKFVDQNNDGKIDPNDRVILGSPFPKFIFGLNNTFAYKGFNLNVLITAVQGIKTLDGNIIESLYPINFERNRLAAHYLDRWTPSNTDAKYPSGVNPSSYGGALAINSMTVTDASFGRLKTVTLGYDIPLSGKKIKSASVYLAADNLLTITRFQGFDPDANASGTSSSLTANTSNAGVSGGSIEHASYNSYPLNRTFRVGLNISF
jgi:TonB-linked SusC/RagA family outer membrane protein